MKVLDFFKDICLTDFSFVCLCIVGCMVSIAFVLLIIGVVTHQPYENNKLSYRSCHIFMIVMQVAWIILLIALIIEFFAVFAYAFMVKIEGLEFMIRMFVSFFLIAGVVELAIIVFDNGGRYVGHRTPYEEFARFAKPIFWKD